MEADRRLERLDVYGNQKNPPFTPEQERPRFELLSLEEAKQERLEAEAKRLGMEHVHDAEDRVAEAVRAGCANYREAHAAQALRATETVNRMLLAQAAGLMSTNTAMHHLRPGDAGEMIEGLDCLFRAAALAMEACCMLCGIKYKAPESIAIAQFDTVTNPNNYPER